MSDEIRVGVFVCDCGTNINGAVTVSEVAEFAKTLPDVVVADEGKWICSVDYLARIKQLIEEHNVNRVVVASCTPRTHEPLFKKTVAETGLNPYLLEFVSIREQVSWVHRTDVPVATEKAKDLVKMAVMKARLLEEGEEISLPVGQTCMVIGGGVTGMTAALAVAKQGYDVKLVEKSDKLGGLLNEVGHIAPDDVDASELVKTLADQVVANPNIELLLGTQVTGCEGYVGNYKVQLGENGSTKEFKADTIIVATGMREIEPVGQFLYGEDPNVVTQLQLEKMLKEGGVAGKKNVVMIQCVNSRNDERGCCHVGCPAAVKNAHAIKRDNPDANVYVLYRDLITYKEEYIHLKHEVMTEGVKFLRYDAATPPEVVKEDGQLKVKVNEVLLGEEVTLPADLLVLTTGFIGDETVDELKGHLKVSTNADGFFQESHIKLGPADFASAGVYLGGSGRSPKPCRDCIEEGLGAAMRASIPMTTGHVVAEGIVAKIDLTDCSKCGLCYKNCPFSAIEQIGDDGKTPHVIEALCKGCGLCAADCPKDCIQIVHYGDEQIMAQIDAALAENPEKKIIGFVCHWCALGAVDIAGVGRADYPPNIRIIRVMCSARVDRDMIMRAFEQNAGGVLVAGCEFPTCHYITGNYKCKDRLDRTRKRLEKAGYDTSKLWEVWLSAAMGPKWVATQKEMVKALGLDK